MPLTESPVEQATLSWLASLGYTSIFGTGIAPDQPRCPPSWATAKGYLL